MPQTGDLIIEFLLEKKRYQIYALTTERKKVHTAKTAFEGLAWWYTHAETERLFRGYLKIKKNTLRQVKQVISYF